jgi:SAM-dependent methyltransferase
MILAVRSNAAELMDTDCVDAADYARCLRDLARVNTVTLARRPTLAWLDRAMRRRAQGEAISVYDVAFGHGDMLRAVARWGQRRGRAVALRGVDLNPAAPATARAASPDLAMELAVGDVLTTLPEPSPDYIISSLFTHHLSDEQVVAFLQWMERHARHGWFVNDLHRHAVPYHGFRLLAWAMRWHRFVQHDGPVSIGRAFRMAEWRRLLDLAGVQGEVRWVFPFRICVGRLRCLTP